MPWYCTRAHMSRATVARMKNSPCPVALTAHDEAMFTADEGQEVEAKAFALKCFGTAPKWWPDLPVSSEADFGYAYSDAK